jgi:adenine-specific DNA-methyltransferase
LWLTADHRVLIRRRRYEMSGKRDWSHTPPISFTRARELRHNLTPAEQLLWSRLRSRQLGAKFRKQHPIGPYIVDFYCAERALIIEVDGDSHFTPEGVEHDAARTNYLTATGLSIVRFTNDEVKRHLDNVVERIQAAAGEPAENFCEEAWWLEAESLRCGDVIYCGTESQPATITEILTEETSEDVYDLEVEGAHSFITDVCAVHNCGSGTTAYVAEQWGRRWITCDTSRVALTLARQRLMTAVYDYYELAHPEEGVGSGFNYRTVPHVTLKSIANDEPPAQETLYDQPTVDRKITRVSGPFTVEAVPAPAVRSVDDLLTPPAPPHAGGIEGGYVARSGETLRQAEWRDELLKTGLRGKAGQHIRFARLEPLPGCRWLHADGETRPSAEGADSVREDAPAYTPLRAVVSFGPQHAPLEQRQVASALEEAQTLVPRPKLVIFAAFQFDPEAAKDIDETRWPGVTMLKAQMNADLLTDDLKKKRASNESFWLIGQPDVRLLPSPPGRGAGGEGLYQVEVLGFDYYNTKTGAIESGGADKIAVWLLDTDYDGRSLFPRQVFFPLAGENEGWARLARNLKAEIDPDLIEAYRGTVSLPFEPGEHRRIAVKIVDDRGIESLKVVRLEE